jgi:hypothetical protein
MIVGLGYWVLSCPRLQVFVVELNESFFILNETANLSIWPA